MIRTMIHMLLSLLVMVSVTGFTVNLHYCQEQLYDIAIFAPASSCCETGDHSTMGCHVNLDRDPDHCDDATIQVESPEDFFISSIYYDTPVNGFSDLFLLNYPTFKCTGKTGDDRAVNVPRYRLPPTGKQDMLSMIQSYLL